MGEAASKRAAGGQRPSRGRGASSIQGWPPPRVRTELPQRQAGRAGGRAGGEAAESSARRGPRRARPSQAGPGTARPARGGKAVGHRPAPSGAGQAPTSPPTAGRAAPRRGRAAPPRPPRPPRPPPARIPPPTPLALSSSHHAVPLGRLPGRRPPREAADVVFARFELFAALWTKLELTSVPALLARPAHVGRRAVVHLEAPELGERARAAGVGAEEAGRVVARDFGAGAWRSFGGHGGQEAARRRAARRRAGGARRARGVRRRPRARCRRPRRA